MIGRIPQLPHWCITDKYPAFYDTESATAIEQTAKLYGAIQEIIKDYNKFAEEVNQIITEFIESANQDQEEFKCKITKIMHDYIAKIDEKIKLQDYKMNEAIDYMKNNIMESISELFREMKENDEFNDVILEVLNDIKEKLVSKTSELENDSNFINEQQMNEKIEKSIAQTISIPTNEDIEKMKIDVRKNICSYLNVINPCESRVGNAVENGVPVCGVYETAKGYLGLIGWGEFDTSDTRTINGIEHKVFKAECGTLASLIYKDISYENSPYFKAFNNIVDINSDEMYMSALENQSQQKPYTIDMFEQWTARYVAYNQDKAGNTAKQISIKTANGVETNTDLLNSLETGDMIFIGYSTKVDDGNYKGVNHIAVYVKTLEELNAYGIEYGVSYRAWNGHEDNGHGYVFEMMPSSDSTNDYSNCVRLTALDDYINIGLGDREWISILACKPYSNQQNDNKALKLARNMEVHYKHLTMFDMNPSQRNKRASYNFTTGEMELRSLKLRGIQQQEIIDLNTILDNCVLTFMNKSLATNLPENFPNVNFTLINIGGIDTAATKQIILCAGSNPKIYIRVLPNSFNNTSESWGEWKELLTNTPTYQLINEGDSLNNLLQSGGYYAQSITNISNLPSGFTTNTAFTVEVERNATGRFIKQLLTVHSKTNPQMFVRISGNVVSPDADDWSEWKQITLS